MDFKCKQFELNHSSSTMKIGTDAVLLASCVNRYLNKAKLTNILDVGTGCGIIALFMAQIFPQSNVFAIDIDKESIDEATDNFSKNAFKNKMSAQCISYQEFADRTTKKFDLIVSNPPFFTSSLQSPNKKRTLARHNNSLSLEDFVTATQKITTDQSFIAVILPIKESVEITRLFSQTDFCPVKIIEIKAKPDTLPHRRITLFSSNENIAQSSNNLQSPMTDTQQSLCIRDERSDYTDDYKLLTSPFLL